MAKISSNDILDLSQNWSKDPANGLPFSGRAVQKFLKEVLNTKFGCFYYDATTNRYLVFSNEESKDKYLDNPLLTELVLGSFDAPFNYSAEINLISDSYVAIPLGSTGNYIEFTFDTKNKNGSSVGEDVICTYTIIRGSYKKTITQKYRSGSTVRFNVDEYLDEGSNRITIGIVGQNTFAATTIGVTYQVVNLTLTDNTNISSVYDLVNGSRVLSVPFTLSGYGVKIVEWYLDGEKLDFEKNIDEVVDVVSTRTKYITLSNLSRGTHYVEFRAYTIVDNEKFYSKVLHRDIIVENSGISDNSPIIALSYEKEDIEDTVINLAQYLSYDLIFSVYNPQNPVYTEVEVFLGDEKVTILKAKNGEVNTYSVAPTKTGKSSIRLIALEEEYSLSVFIAENSMGINEITADLELGFSAIGRSNNEYNRETWEGNGHTAVLTGFNFTQTSGWVNNRLLMQNGSTIVFDYAPLGNGSTTTGRTLEFEFASSNVSDDTAVLCDLMGSNGSGVIITASEAKIVSRGGVTLSVKYKSEENTRISFVINKANNATNKGLVFIYVNGVISGAINFGASDDFISNASLSFRGTTAAEILLKQVRIYRTALSSDQILNNFILYRDSTREMLEVFDRNNIYEEGTANLSVDKLQGQLPVMIVTGDIPTLENTTNKNTQITVDIEYFNIQDPSKNFTMKNAAMRPQGTSSMLYPKKNFRIYTQKLSSTVLTVNGEIVEDRLYSFVDGAQPVNCWCLKADYAESSGTHNTGIARLWNHLLFNSTVDGEYVFRTEAQKKAIENGYNYDVRTTIDGFPILMFYRREENSELIFIGKYNFNNDKSTESVFGFTGIPGFDNSRMQCWEVLNNGDALALFTDVSDFDARWREAYESRYPDTSNPNTADLKNFSVWINGVKDNPEAFSSQKWEHLNVYLVAAYYVYLMRFGAVDQPVKNAMFTSEDGVHFYFINYDNDTINGLRNNGVLAFDPTIDRQSLDPATGGLAYAYAGHDSVLWNLLEGDSEFMEIVKKVDNSLYSSGLRYDNVLKYFDDYQSSMWNERIYNQDAQYKYIGPYTDAGNNNLLMLQGKRQSHRRWWISKRFSLYDAKFVSGDFTGKAFEFKVINNTEPGWNFTIKAGAAMEYGYGVYNPVETGVALNEGESHSFTIRQTLNIGDPVRIYSAVNLMSVDLSNILPRLSNVELNNVWNEVLGSKLKELILGNGVSTNGILTSISSISKAKRLEKLDIRGCKGITSLDLSELLYLNTFLAKGSGLTSIDLAKGAGVTLLSLPKTIQVLRLEELTSLTSAGLELEDNGAGIHSISVENCPKLSGSIDFPLLWIDNKTAPDEECTLYMDNVDWSNVDPASFLTICNAKLNGMDVVLKGRIRLSGSSLEVINTITEAFGAGAFKPMNELYISAPDALYLYGPDSILEGESAQFNAIVFSENLGRVTYQIYSGSRTGTSIDSNTGYLTSTENGLSDSTLTIRAMHRSTDGKVVYTDKSLKIVKRIYPSSVTIQGPVNPNKESNQYTWSTPTSGVNGAYTAEWALSGDIVGYARISHSSNSMCTVVPIQQPLTMVSGKITLSIKRNVDSAVMAAAYMDLNMLNENVIMTNVTNPEVMAIMYANGLAANEEYMTKEEAESVVDTDLQSSNTNYTTSIFYNKRIKTFEEFEYFTGVLTCPSFYGAGNQFKSIKLPPNIKKIGEYSFYDLFTGFSLGELPEGVEYVYLHRFNAHTSIEEGKRKIKVPSSATYVRIDYVYGADIIEFEEGITRIDRIIDVTSNFILPKSLLYIDKSFSRVVTDKLVIPKNVNLGGMDLFENCNIKEVIFECPAYCFVSGIIGLQNMQFIEGEESHLIKDGIVYSLNNFRIPEFFYAVYNLSYSGDKVFEFPQGTSRPVNIYRSKSNLGSLFNSVETIIFPSNLYIPPENDVNEGFSRMLSLSLLSEYVIPEGCNVHIDEQGLIIGNADGKIYGTAPNVPESVTLENLGNIVSYALRNSRFKHVVLSGGTITISWAFQDSKVEKVTIKGGIREIPRYCFYDCSRLKEVEVLDVPKILLNNEAFYGCGLLESISCAVFFNGGEIFRRCENLREITIADDCSVIRYATFSGCSKLKHIYCKCATAPNAEDSFGDSTSNYTGRGTYATGENILYVPQGATGYDSGEWADPLCNSEKCGFTLSATL